MENTENYIAEEITALDNTNDNVNIFDVIANKISNNDNGENKPSKGKEIIDDKNSISDDKKKEEDKQEEKVESGQEEKQGGNETQQTNAETKTILEKYKYLGIEKEEDFDFVINDYKHLMAENKNLKAEVEKIKNSTTLNENQQKLFDYVKKYDGTNAQAIYDYIYLKELDLSKMSDKDILKEVYVRESELDRAKAEKLFEREYSNKYNTDDLDAEDEEIVKLQLERDAKKAMATLKKLKEEINVTSSKDENQKVLTKNDEDFEKRIKENASKFLNESSGITEMEFGFDFGSPVKYKLSDKQISDIKNYMDIYLTNKSNYSQDGKLIDDGVSPKELFNKIAIITNFDDIIKKVASEFYKHGELKRIRENNGLKPENKSLEPSKGGETGNMFDQIYQQIKNNKK